MADLELENVADSAIQGLKRPRDDGIDDDAPSESVQIADSPPASDDIVHAAKKLRPDDAVDAGIDVPEQAAEASADVGLAEAEDIAKANEETDQGVVQIEGEGKDGPGEASTEVGLADAEDIAKANKETEQGYVRSEGEGKDEAGANALRAQEEHLQLEGAAEDGDHLGKKVDSIKVQDGAKQGVKEVKLGPKVFTSSLDMFNFFYDLLRGWPINFNVNKYEHMMLEALISKGHQEPQKKIGAGIEAFQIRVNPEFYSRCYYVIRKDGSTEDFSYRKCVDNLMPLPDNMKSPSTDLNTGHKGQHGKGRHDNKGRGGRFGSARGRGRGGRKRF